MCLKFCMILMQQINFVFAYDSKHDTNQKKYNTNHFAVADNKVYNLHSFETNLCFLAAYLVIVWSGINPNDQVQEESDQVYDKQGIW